MSIKRTTIIVVGGVAVAAWLSAAMTPGRAPAVPTAIRSAPIDATGAVLSREVARLRERLRPEATPRQASRNPFVFRSPSSASRVASRSLRGNVGAVATPPTDALVNQPRFSLLLAGVAEDPGPAGAAAVRTAIITGNGQLFLAKEGDTVTDRDVEYKVGTISSDSAELIDARDGNTKRLTLK